MLRKKRRTSVKNDTRSSVRKKTVKGGGDFCRALFEWGDEAIFLFDRVGRCLDVNPSGCQLLGLSRRRLRNRLLTDILLPLNGMDNSRQLQGLRRGQMKTCRVRICRNDGREVTVDVRAKGLAQGCKVVVLCERSVSLPTYDRLQESERFLDSVLEHLPNMVFIKDAADLRFIRFNKAGEELLGYSRDELLGKNDYDFFPKHEADFFTAKDREVLASGRLLDIAEEPIQTRARGVRLLHTKKIPILAENGTPQYLLGLSEDITEQYQQRGHGVERREKLRRLAELSVALSGDPVDVFDQAVRLIGELFSVKVVYLSEIVGRDLHFKSVYADGQVFRDAGTCPLAVTPCATVEMSKDVRVFNQVIERFPEALFLKDHRAVAYCGFPSVDHRGQVVAVTCLLDDRPHEFTEEDQHLLRLFGQRIAAEVERAREAVERKGMDDRVRASEARLEFLLSSTPGVIYSFRPSGDYGVIFISDNVTKILGYSPDEFIANSRFWADRIHPDDRDRVFAELPNLFEYDTCTHEYRFLHKDGTYRWLRDELRAVYNQDKQPIELVGCMIDITNRKQAEEALRLRESEIRMLVENSQDFIVRLDREARQMYANPATARLYGLPLQDFLGKNLREMGFPEDVWRPAEEACNQVLASRQAVTLEQMHLFGGTPRYFEARHVPEFAPDGSVTSVLVVTREITERKHAEEERQKFVSLADNSQEFIGMADTEFRPFYINATGLRLVGLPNLEAACKVKVQDFFFPEDQPFITNEFFPRVARDERGEVEIRFRHFQTGEPLWMLYTVFKIHDSRGHVVGWATVSRDISARKRTEEALRTSEERLRLALYATKQGLYDLDLKTGVAQVNDEYATMLGYDPDEFEETNAWWVERLHDDDREKVCGIFDAYVRGAIPTYEVEFRQHTKSGDWKWILSTGSIVSRDADGRPLRMLGTHLDITERKQAELAMKRQEALLESFFSQSLDGCFFMMLDEPVEWNDAVDKDQVLEQIFARQHLTRVNDAMLLQYGADREQFVGLTPNDLFANNLQNWKEVWRSMLDRKRLAVQTAEQKLDRTPMWIEGEYVCLYDEQGRFFGHFGVQREITAQKRMEEDLRSNGARLSEAQRLAKLGNWELDLLSNHLIWSDEIYRIFEMDRERFDASYETFLSAVHPDDRMMVNDAYTTSLAERKPYSLIHRLLMPDGRIKYVQEHGETDYDERLQPIRSRGTVQDVTDRRMAELRIEASLHEKETLLREVHHRVKNNLQIISSLLYFQSKKIRDPQDLSAFREGQDRLKSMILVHEKLYRSDDLMCIEFGDYVRALTDGICQSYMSVSTRVKLVIDVPLITLPVEIAMPVGMIVNELLSNAFKYAFPDGRGGSMWICAIRLEREIELLVIDSGVGLPEEVNPERPTTFGLQLIHGLISQLGGRVLFERQGGTSVRVYVPLPVPA